MHAPPEQKKAESRVNEIQPSDHETSKGTEIMARMPHGVESVKREQSRSRLTKPGIATKTPVLVLLREMRRTIREHGQLPRIEWNDARLSRAWESLAVHLARNAKVSSAKTNLFGGAK